MHNLLKAILITRIKTLAETTDYCATAIIVQVVCIDNGYYDKDYGLLGKCLFKTAPYSTSNDLLITSGWFSMKTVVQATNYQPG